MLIFFFEIPHFADQIENPLQIDLSSLTIQVSWFVLLEDLVPNLFYTAYVFIR